MSPASPSHLSLCFLMNLSSKMSRFYRRGRPALEGVVFTYSLFPKARRLKRHERRQQEVSTARRSGRSREHPPLRLNCVVAFPSSASSSSSCSPFCRLLSSLIPSMTSWKSHGRRRRHHSQIPVIPGQSRIMGTVDIERSVLNLFVSRSAAYHLSLSDRYCS